MDGTVRGKRDIWRCDETLFFIQVMKKKNVLKLMKGKRYRVEEIFKLVEKEFRQAGFSRTAKQLLIKYKGLKKSFYDARRRMAKEGTNTAKTCPYYQELTGLFGLKPIIVKQETVEPTVSSPVYEEVVGAYNFCEIGTEALSNGLDIEAPSINHEVRSMYDDLADPRDGAVPGGSKDPDPIVNEILPDTSQPLETIVNEQNDCSAEAMQNAEPTEYIPPRTTSAPSKRGRRHVASRPYSARQQSFFNEQRDSYKEFAREIMRSHEKMVERTIAEQRRSEERAWAAHRDILADQTTRLLAGLQNILYPQYPAPNLTGHSVGVSVPSSRLPEIGKQSPPTVYPSATPSPSIYSSSPPPDTDLPNPSCQEESSTPSDFPSSLSKKGK